MGGRHGRGEEEVEDDIRGVSRVQDPGGSWNSKAFKICMALAST